MKQGVFCQFTLIKTSTLHTLQLLLQLQIDSFTPEDARNTLDMKFLLIVTVTYPTIYFLFTIVIFHFRWGAILFALKHFLSLSPVTNQTGDNAASVETANTTTHCRADNPIPHSRPCDIYLQQKEIFHRTCVYNCIFNSRQFRKSCIAYRYSYILVFITFLVWLVLVFLLFFFLVTITGTQYIAAKSLNKPFNNN